MTCVRCGSTEQIERHHIRQRIHGGSDDDENMEDRCVPCHKFEHVKRNIVRAIKKWTKRLKVEQKESLKKAMSDRLKLLNHRLEVLEKLNTPEIIRATGKYTPYWTDKTTHNTENMPIEFCDLIEKEKIKNF